MNVTAVQWMYHCSRRCAWWIACNWTLLFFKHYSPHSIIRHCAIIAAPCRCNSTQFSVQHYLHCALHVVNIVQLLRAIAHLSQSFSWPFTNPSKIFHKSHNNVNQTTLACSHWFKIARSSHNDLQSVNQTKSVQSYLVFSNHYPICNRINK